MLLPKNVLDLFPIWEYRCPICQTYVDATVDFCPNCKSIFNEEKWRVPPRFFKNHKAMAKYAHEVLAPKLSRAKRGLLFKYFTIIFSDGFETSVPPNFDAAIWTQATNGTGTCVSESTHPHSGTYDCKVTTVANGDYGEVIHTIVPTTTTYGRVYVYFATLTLTNNGDFFDVGIFLADATFSHYAIPGVYRDTGVNLWSLEYNEGGGDTHVQGTHTPNLGQWYCVELQRDVFTQSDSLTIDTILEVDTGAIFSTNDTVEIDVGVVQIATGSSEIYFDDVVIADAPIGPLITGAPALGTFLR